ncbi:AraC family transcriptional regulator [Azospirillum sp. A29]|uniref:AraC family transcriptional regulator n=1 Tax=unclassified Azospirillum TaxID=2630922 RepID=UPI00366C3FE7
MTTDTFLHMTTKGLNQKKAKEYWSDHVGNACYNVKLNFNDDEIFEADVDCKVFSFGTLTHFRLNGSHEAERTPYYISRDNSEAFCVALVLDGNAEVSCGSRDLMWKGEGVYCGGNSIPYHFAADRSLNFTAIYFDISYMRSIIPNPEILHLKEMSSGTGWGRALAAVMREITPRTIDHLALPPGAVADHVLGLLALSIGPEIDHLTSSQRSLRERLRQNMRDRLFDPSLNPTSFAAEHGISVRTLHAVFTVSGNSFMRELLGMRLFQARSLLEDRRYNAKTIAEIALLVGFVNADHFTARFRKAFGVPPTEWRRRSGKK